MSKSRKKRRNPKRALRIPDLEQIQYLLGYVSTLTAERCLGSKQKLRLAVNDNLGLDGDFFPPSPQSPAAPLGSN
jgi:hypothetical protein